jgi:hypothetical protein
LAKAEFCVRLTPPKRGGAIAAVYSNFTRAQQGELIHDHISNSYFEVLKVDL